MKGAVTLQRLLECVSATFGVDADTVKKPSKNRTSATVRGIICHLAIFELGYTGSEVGRFLHLGPTGVSLASRRGEKALKADLIKMQEIMASIEK